MHPLTHLEAVEQARLATLRLILRKCCLCCDVCSLHVAMLVTVFDADGLGALATMKRRSDAGPSAAWPKRLGANRMHADQWSCHTVSMDGHHQAVAQVTKRKPRSVAGAGTLAHEQLHYKQPEAAAIECVSNQAA